MMMMITDMNWKSIAKGVEARRLAAVESENYELAAELRDFQNMISHHLLGYEVDSIKLFDVLYDYCIRFTELLSATEDEEEQLYLLTFKIIEDSEIEIAFFVTHEYLLKKYEDTNRNSDV